MRDRLAIEREAAACQGAGTERQDVDARERLLQALKIAREHFKVGEQVMRPEHGLRAAQVRVAGDDGLRIFFCEREQSRHQSRQLLENRVGGSAKIEPHVERNLLIAAAAGMDLVGERAHLRFNWRMTKVWTSSSVAPSK